MGSPSHHRSHRGTVNARGARSPPPLSKKGLDMGKRDLLCIILLCVALAILLSLFSTQMEPIPENSVNPDDFANIPERETFFDADALANFFEDNRALFEDVLEMVEDNQTRFCIDTWWGEPEILSHEGRATRKEDIANYSELVSAMDRLSMTRIDYS